MSEDVSQTERRLSNSAAQIDALDGIRGVAVLLVLLSHLSGMPLIPVANFGGVGKAGVYLFFVLSAFLLTLGFLRKGVENLAWRELAFYALRRFLRIYPVFVIALTLACVHLEGFSHGRMPWFDVSKFWANLTLQRGDGVFWTIGVEFKYYLVIPLVAFAHLVIFRSRLGLSAVALGAAAVGSALAWPIPPGPDLSINSLAPYLPIFLVGSLAAIAFHRYPVLAQPWRLGAGVVAWFAAAGAVVLIPSVIGALFNLPSAHEVVARWILVWAALWGALVLGALLGVRLPRRLFEVRWLRRVGQLCLGCYLFHEPIITVVKLNAHKFRLAIPYVEGWLIIALVFVVAELSLRFIEKPLSNTKAIERWARGMPRYPAEAPIALADEPGASA
jgi:peptidoglycan/LPS O-acetylase OafA/YrhL